MKKVLFILAFLAIGMIATAQTQTIYNQLKLATVNDGTASDSLVLVQGTDKIIRKIPLSSISGSTEIPSLQEVTNNGNVTSHPIHAKEFRVDSNPDSLMVLNNRYFSIGDLGNEYGGNWNKYMTVFDPQDYPEGLDIYNCHADGGYNLVLDRDLEYGNHMFDVATRDVRDGEDSNTANIRQFPSSITSSVFTSPYGSGTTYSTASKVSGYDFRVYHEFNPEYMSFKASNTYDVLMGDVNGQLDSNYSNKINVDNSGNRIQIIAPNRLDMGSTNAKFKVQSDETLELLGTNIVLRSNPSASTVQLEAGAVNDNRVFIFPDATGIGVIVNTTAPSSSSDTGAVGEIRVTTTYIYVCIADNTWVRAPLATW